MPVDGRDTAAREAIAFAEPAGADVDRATTDLLAVAAAGPEREPRAAVLRSAPRVADGEADSVDLTLDPDDSVDLTLDPADSVDLTLDPADSVDPVASANADGAEASSPPIPNATARAPTRPT